MKISCIYKITSPSNKIYIGQTVDFNKRYNDYKRCSNCSQQIRLFHSIKKYGIENHKIEILEICSIESLNNKERYWQDFYNVLSKNGLNCILTNSDEKRKVLSDEVKYKIGSFNRGKKLSLETRIKMSISMKGKPKSDETKRKLSEINKGKKRLTPAKPISEETKKKMSESAKKRGISEKALIALKKHRKYGQLGGENPSARIVINEQNGIFYECIKDAAFSVGIKYQTLYAWLSGRNKNKTNLKLI